MARQLKSNRKHETGRSITTSTPYGTTSDMIITDEEILSKLTIPSGSVLCEDDAGYYYTPKDRVDNGLADPCRHDIVVRELIGEVIDRELGLSNPK